MSHYYHHIDPIALKLPAFTVAGMHFEPAIHWYGVMYLMGFALAWWLGSRRVRAGRLPGVDPQAYGDLMFYGMLGVVFGGRIGYILFYAFPDFLRDPSMIVRVWDGGMSFHGGLLGVLAAIGWWSRKHRMHFFDTVDFIAPLVPPGLGFGRLGNFIGGELWGKPSGVPWAVIFPKAQAEDMDFVRSNAALARQLWEHGGLPRHPSQLYEATLEGLVLFTVLIVFSAKPRHRYAVSGLFGLLYGCFRFLVEFVRVPDAQLGYLAFGWLTMGQILSLPLIATGLVLLALSRRAPILAPETEASARSEMRAGPR